MCKCSFLKTYLWLVVCLKSLDINISGLHRKPQNIGRCPRRLSRHQTEADGLRGLYRCDLNTTARLPGRSFELWLLLASFPDGGKSSIFINQLWFQKILYLLSMMSTTEPSGLMKAENSSCVSRLADTPTLWDPSHRNLLRKTGDLWFSLNCWGWNRRSGTYRVMKDHVLPEMGDAVESRLLVEDVTLCIHDYRAVHKVFNPVWPTSLVQRQVPVSPAHDIVIQVLPRRKHPQINIYLLQLCCKMCYLFCVNESTGLEPGVLIKCHKDNTST